MMPMAEPFTDDDRAELIAYMDGELAGEAQRRVENRLITDAAVRAEADSLKRAWDLLDYLPRPEPSTDFTERTLTRVSALQVPTAATEPELRPTAGPSGRRPALIWGSFAAAALLALVAGYSLTPGPRPITPAEVDLATDTLMVQEPGVIENLPLYLAAENLEYLLALDQSDLFTDDGAGR
jgi:anti-sigma factor RsiW